MSARNRYKRERKKARSEAARRIAQSDAQWSETQSELMALADAMGRQWREQDRMVLEFPKGGGLPTVVDAPLNIGGETITPRVIKAQKGGVVPLTWRGKVVGWCDTRNERAEITDDSAREALGATPGRYGISVGCDDASVFDGGPRKDASTKDNAP